MANTLVHVRGYRAGDETAILALWNRCLPADTISMDRFAAHVLLDTNFDPEGFLVAEREGQAVGFLLAITRGTPMQGLDNDPEDGWITVFFVDPDYRGQGIGQALLDRGRAHIVARGRHRVSVSPYAPNYFWPGVDTTLYPQALGFLRRNGFEVLYTPVAMDLNLVAYSIPLDVLEVQRLREQEGYSFGSLRTEQIVDVLAFNTRHFSADWARAIREALRRGVSRERVLVVSRQGEIAGFCLYGGYDGVAERFGPFGVDPTLRGTGLGKVLLYRCLDRMRSEGLHTAWFLWTGLEEPAGRLYTRVGFQVSRTFAVLRGPARAEDRR
ncbi:MAG TPA: GNAT family N-acetyltransferase [Chloroflexota bacterium]|nr:GNAT family N-acetyltransferase [Chloroflexota bacterium]